MRLEGDASDSRRTGSPARSAFVILNSHRCGTRPRYILCEVIRLLPSCGILTLRSSMRGRLGRESCSVSPCKMSRTTSSQDPVRRDMFRSCYSIHTGILNSKLYEVMPHLVGAISLLSLRSLARTHYRAIRLVLRRWCLPSLTAHVLT